MRWPWRRHSDSAGPVDSAGLGRKGESLARRHLRRAGLGKKVADPAVLGKKGEAFARKHLRKGGLKILARNYRCAAGEADLIALDRRAGQIVFVEVKTRSDDTYVEPYAAVDSAKQQRYGRIARTYLAERDTGELAVRFDIVSVVIPPGGKPAVTHIPQAFSP